MGNFDPLELAATTCYGRGPGDMGVQLFQLNAIEGGCFRRYVGKTGFRFSIGASQVRSRLPPSKTVSSPKSGPKPNPWSASSLEASSPSHGRSSSVTSAPSQLTPLMLVLPSQISPPAEPDRAAKTTEPQCTTVKNGTFRIERRRHQHVLRRGEP